MTPEDAQELEALYTKTVREHKEQMDALGDSFREAEAEAFNFWDFELPDYFPRG
jgi:hypothetical protein